MKVTFVSNYYNHHQAPFAKEMDELTHHEFRFIETSPMEDERRKMGWGAESKPDYVLQSYLDKSNYRQCQQMIDEADAVIWGSCPFRMIRPRLRKGKLTFAYSERIFKEGYRGIAYWGRAVKYFSRLAPYQRNHYLLCASAYTAGDYARIGLFHGKALKWGYFPEAKEYNIEELMNKKSLATTTGLKHPLTSILWVGRLIGLKHPESAVQLAEKLKQTGYTFDLNIIGTGELEEQIRGMISEKKLDDCVHMLGAMSPEEVRQHMEEANIFLFTSDQNEGWGAVLNEAMNSGCAVIASNVVGSAPFLIRDGVNGLIYKYGDKDDLVRKMIYLLDDATRAKNLGREAYAAITKVWNAQTAANRLKELISCIELRKLETMYNCGPLSAAETIAKETY